MRETIQAENAAALKRDEARYKNTTDGAWLDDREDYYKALTESQYVRRRSRLVEMLFLWWSDVLRASTGVARRELPSGKNQTAMLGQKLTTAEILRRIRRLEEMRDHLGPKYPGSARHRSGLPERVHLLILSRRQQP